MQLLFRTIIQLTRKEQAGSFKDYMSIGKEKFSFYSYFLMIFSLYYNSHILYAGKIYPIVKAAVESFM